jgi:hypothetical protein
MRLSGAVSLTGVHVAVGVLSLALNAAAGAWGAWSYWRASPNRWFWRLLRSGQVAIVLEAALGGILTIDHKTSSLHLLYGLLPLGISFVAEQLRVVSAQMVLDARGFESTAQVGELPHDEQRSLVTSILLREMGVMTLSAIVNVALLARAAGTGG